MQIKDKNGKDVVSLIDDLRQKMPLNIATIIQRMKLEEVRRGNWNGVTAGRLVGGCAAPTCSDVFVSFHTFRPIEYVCDLKGSLGIGICDSFHPVLHSTK